MKSLVLVGALVALARALPQEIAFDVVDEAAAPPQITVPVDVTAQTIAYNDDAAASSAAALITADPLPQATIPAVATTLSKRAVEKRDACASQPPGAGPVPSPDAASAFLAYPNFAATASAAPTPSGYDNTFTNLQASNNAYGYLGLTTVQSYDTNSCASQCNAIQGCSAFNIYFERDPSVDPASNCPNPASTTNIKCVFWGGPVTAANAKNTGQLRTQFQVVIAGSNGYVSKSIGPQDGYNGPNVLGNAAINAPLDCGGFNTFMGSKIFTSGPFDAGLCSAACTAQSNYNLRHPPATGKPQTCQFYNTYMLYKNNIAQGQYCAMYSMAWDNSYATNTGQYRGSDHYTIQYSYSFTNSTNPGAPAIPCPVASASSIIKTSSLQPYCSSLLGYTVPSTTKVTTTTSTAPGVTVVQTSTPITTTVTTTTQLVAVTQQRKRDLPAAVPTPCDHDHDILRRRSEPLKANATEPDGSFVDKIFIVAPNPTTVAQKVRRDATPAGLASFPSDVVSSACALNAGPATSTSTILSTATAVVTADTVTQQTVGPASTVTQTSTVTSTTTIIVASNAPTGVIGYLEISPTINSGASYALSDPATHMTDNYYSEPNRETFIVTSDGYLYSVTHNAYYFISPYTQYGVDYDYSYLYWDSNKSNGQPVFTSTTNPDGSWNVKLKRGTSGTDFYNFCMSTAASGDGNSATGLHVYAFNPASSLFPSSSCISINLVIRAA